MLGLLLSCLAALAAPPEVVERVDVLTVEAARLDALGGPVDCLVRWAPPPAGQPPRASVVRCPEPLRAEVEQATVAWRFAEGAWDGPLLAVLMVRPEGIDTTPVEPEPLLVYARRGLPLMPLAPRSWNDDYAARTVLARCIVRLQIDGRGRVVATDLDRCPLDFHRQARRAARQTRFTRASAAPLAGQWIPLAYTFVVQ